MSETPLPEQGAVRGARSNAVLIAAVVLLPLLAIASGLLVWTVTRSDGTTRPPKTIELVVPKGARKRLDAGEAVVVMPNKLEFRVGDRIVIRNEDIVNHSVGPYHVRPGEEFTFTFGSPGRYAGYCPVSDGKRYEIVVKK